MSDFIMQPSSNYSELKEDLRRFHLMIYPDLDRHLEVITRPYIEEERISWTLLTMQNNAP